MSSGNFHYDAFPGAEAGIAEEVDGFDEELYLKEATTARKRQELQEQRKREQMGEELRKYRIRADVGLCASGENSPGSN
jgi:hypothetical protein